MPEKKFGAITSSQNPEEIATKIKGITLALSSVIIFLASQFFHLQLTSNDVLSLATELGAISGAIMTLYGVGMHMWAFFFKK